MIEKYRVLYVQNEKEVKLRTRPETGTDAGPGDKLQRDKHSNYKCIAHCTSSRNRNRTDVPDAGWLEFEAFHP